MAEPIELDSVYLVDRLKARSRPRDRVTTLLRSGEINRVKKGLYVRSGEPYSREILANLICGPSCVSFESALAYYDLIPEPIRTVTSATTQKDDAFETPVGRFEYRHLGLRCYFPRGVLRGADTGTRSVWIEATVEREGSGGQIESAFAKMNTLSSFIAVGASNSILRSIAANRRIRVKFEVDIDAPGEFDTEAKYLLDRFPAPSRRSCCRASLPVRCTRS